jgi:Mn-containing catalase
MLDIVWRKRTRAARGRQNVQKVATKHSNAWMYALKNIQAEEQQRLGKAPNYPQIVEQLTTDGSPSAARVRSRMQELVTRYERWDANRETNSLSNPS